MLCEAKDVSEAQAVHVLFSDLATGAQSMQITIFLVYQINGIAHVSKW